MENKPKRKLWKWVLLVLGLLFLLVMCFGSSPAPEPESVPEYQPTYEITPTPYTPAPEPVPEYISIGDTVEVRSNVYITLNSFDGRIANLTATNYTGSDITIAALNFYIRCTEHYRHGSTIDINLPRFGGSVPSGGTIRGEIAFDVPYHSTAQYLVYSAVLRDSTRWRLY